MVGFNRNFPSMSMGGRIFTVFIDNLPNGVGLPWLRKFCSNFGMVKDAYLPLRRSKRTGNRFGFVKYESIKGADQAIEKANGFWIGKKHLIVERASFDLAQHPGVVFRNTGFSSNKFFVHKGINQGEIWEDKMKGKKDERRISLNLQPVAVEWLSRSVVAKLKALTTPELVQNALKDFKFNDVVVKSLGGLKLIITFQTRADRAAAMGNLVIVNWFNSFKPWNGEVAGESRLIWLKCRGMPLTVWNAASFKRLSEIWGDFITLDVETLKEESYDVGRMLIATEHPQKIDDWINITARGKNHRVKIWEEECDDIFNEKPVRDWVNKQHAEIRFFPISDHVVENGSCKRNTNAGDDVGLNTLAIQYEGEDEVSQVKALEKLKEGGTITVVQKSSNEVAPNRAKEKVDDLANHFMNDNIDEKEKVDDLAIHALVDMVVDQINENTDVINENNVMAAMDSISSSLEKESSVVGSEKVLESVMVIDEAIIKKPDEESDKEDENNLEEFHFNHNVNTIDRRKFGLGKALKSVMDYIWYLNQVSCGLHLAGSATKNPGKTQPLKSKTNKKTLQAQRENTKELPVQSQRRVFGTTRNPNIPSKAVSDTNVSKTKPNRHKRPLRKNPSIQVSPKQPEPTQSSTTPAEKKSPEKNRAKVNSNNKKKSVGFKEQTGKGCEVVLEGGDGVGHQTPVVRSTSLGKPKRVSGTPYQSAEGCSKCRFDRLETSAYWLGQIKVAESVGKHFVSAAFFRLALESKAEPIRSLRVELRHYVARHEYLSKEAEWRDVSVSYGLIQTEADANSGSSSLDQAQNDVKEEQAMEPLEKEI
ncbi:hypothetical protein Vadar_011144 [Vaccinium darrowii]|uniref:Uncharacterized protein n=1 Tax=Vaccinium darrowii TaxID=229202 RepID=A0ACB7ZBW8_9ERIC|nr:hypothetical protein Vadar_011144 [Vaccinium darrowii]